MTTSTLYFPQFVSGSTASFDIHSDTTKVVIISALIATLLGVWITQALLVAHSREKPTWKTWVHFVASGCLAIGGFSGFTPTMAVKYHWIPESVEWPAGRVEDALINSEGTLVATTPFGRIQVYNKDLEFQRGWFIPALGKTTNSRQ